MRDGTFERLTQLVREHGVDVYITPTGIRMTQGPKPKGSGQVLLLVAFVATLVIFGLLLWQLPRIRQYSSEPLTMFAFVMVGGLAGYWFFHILKSNANLRTNKYGVILELGGPVVVGFLIVGGGLLYERQTRAGEFAFVVYFCLGENHNATIKKDGTLTLLLDEPKSIYIHDGFASAQHVPERWNGRSIGFMIQLDGYQPLHPGEPLVLVAGDQLFVPLQKTAAVGGDK